MTPMALVCWFAYFGYLPVDGTWAAWTAKLWVAILWTVLAVAELVADKLPKTPDRTAPGPLLWRVMLGGMAGSIATIALAGPAIEGVVLAVIGALLGAFGGYMVRRDLVEKTGLRGLAYGGWRRPVHDPGGGVCAARGDQLRGLGVRRALPG